MSNLDESFSNIPFVGCEALVPDDPPEPRVQDTSLVTTCQLLSSWRRVESADTGPVWGAGPCVSETEPGIWTPAVTRCTGHVMWTRDTTVKKLFVSKKETVRDDKGLWLLLPLKKEFLTSSSGCVIRFYIRHIFLYCINILNLFWKENLKGNCHLTLALL